MIPPLVLMVLAEPPPPAGCAAARAAATEAKACAAGPGGVALAATQARAEQLVGLAETGAPRFRAAFGRDAARYAVFEFDDPATIPGVRSGLRTSGFTVSLPLPSAARTATQRQGLPPPPPGASAATFVRRETAGGGGPREESGFVPHELGHLWYAEAFWRDAPRSPTDRYGSPAPDWLDEAAAILMEDEARAELYRRRLTDGRSLDPERSEQVPPEITLTEFVTLGHPVTGLLPATASAGPVQLRGKPSLFYNEARVFADYLIGRSGDPRILAAVSEGLRTHAGFDAWLAAEGARRRLPASLTLMDTDWRAWLVARYGPAR